MIKLELKKLWNLPIILLAVLSLVLTVGEVVCAGRFGIWQEDESLYKWYLEQWEGPYGQGTRIQIEKEQEKMDTLPVLAEEMKKKYMSREITWAEYSDYQADLNYVKTHRSAFGHVQMDAFYLQMQEAEKGRDRLMLFYRKYWEYFFPSGTVSYWTFFLVMVLSLRSFFLEKSSRMLPLLKAGAAGTEGLVEWKKAAVGISAGGAALVYSLVRFVTFLVVWKLPCLDGAVQSLPLFGDVGIPVNLLCAALFCCLLQTAGYVLLSLLVLGIALVCEQEITAVVLSMLLVILPRMVGQELPWLQKVSLFSLLNGTQAIQGMDSWLSAAGLLLVIAGWMFAAELLCELHRCRK